MSETGGPVYEGVGRPEVVKPRLVDKVCERVVNRLKQNTGEIVEQKWMNAYQKTVDALNPGMRKKVAEKIRIVAVGVAKIARVGSAVSDVLLRVRGLGGFTGGILTFIKPNLPINSAHAILNQMYAGDVPMNFPGSDIIEKQAIKTSRKSPKEVRVGSVLTVGQGLVEGALGKARISRVASGWLADVAGSYGEKVAQITNKILQGRPRPVAVVG